MKRLGILVGALLLLAVTVPVFAEGQGMFADVPTDHWAYQAVNELQSKGIIIGYPDGTFGGKRAMTRYEFAMAISRMLEKIGGGPGSVGPAGPQGEPGPAGPQGPGISTEDLDKINKLVNEFKDELKQQGMSIDQIKKDLAALTGRVGAIEDELKRIKVTVRGDMIAQGTFAKRDDVTLAGGVSKPTAVDIDGRPLAPKSSPNNLLNDVAVLWDYDITMKGRVAERTTATLVINASTYLPAVGSISNINTTPGGGPRSRLVGQGGVGADTTEVTPWYFYVEHPLDFMGETNLTIGKFPLQLTPYTFKMVDVDYYTNLPKTDSGDFPVTGIKAQRMFGPLDVTAFGVVHNRNPFVAPPGTAIGTSNEIGNRPFDQTFGVRALWDIHSAGKLGLTYLQAGLSDLSAAQIPGLAAGRTINKAEIYGVDYNSKLMNDRLGIYAEYTKSDYRDGGHGVTITGPAGARSSDKDNNAFDAMATYSFGGLYVGGGYRDIGPNFYSPGAWERIAVVKNPVNIKGGRGTIGYKFSDTLDAKATFEDLSESKSTAADSKVQRITAAANYKLGGGYISLGYENVELKSTINPFTGAVLGGRGKVAEANYFDVGYGHEISSNLSLRFYYQYVDFKDKTGSGLDSKGNIAGTQLTVKF